VSTLYVDVDGTLVGPGGDLFWNGSMRVAEALVACRGAGITVVPVTGRGLVQVREMCRLLGLARGVGELGCVHVAGHEVRYEMGPFPFWPESWPVQAMRDKGAVALAISMGLEAHEPWNEGRVATVVLKGRVDTGEVNAALASAGAGWCELIDNGPLRQADKHAYHLAPKGTGKAWGVAIDRRLHQVQRSSATYVGDGAADLAVAPEVARCWLVANADAGLEWPYKTQGSYGEGVAEVIDSLLAAQNSPAPAVRSDNALP